jgi:hypothetical protein
MEPREGARVCGQAAASLSQVMARTTNPYALLQLAQGLSAVAARMEPPEADRACGVAAATLSRAMAKATEPDVLLYLAQGLSAVVERMEPPEAATALLQAMTKTTDEFALRQLARGLLAVLLREDSSRIQQRQQVVTMAIGVRNCPESVVVAPVLLQPALEPLPPPLPAQALVDLLKQPICVGEARRLVLGQLARHYQRPFADQWDFVRFAQQQKLGLDFTTPPHRPGEPDAAP